MSTSQVNSLTYHDCLPADTEEATRLRVQHEVIQRTLGNIILHVPVDLDVPNAAVLESGTGSGIWLLDLARMVSATTQLIGIDIQSRLFPPRSSVPPNINFEVTSVLDLPPKWNNRFALVHQRLLFVAFNQAEWSKAVNNIYRVLQPGGWLQLLEVDEWARGGPMLRSFVLLWKNILESRGIHGCWPNGLRMWRRLVEEAGFIDIQVKWYETPIGNWAGRDGIDMKEDLVRLMKAARAPAIENDGFGAVSSTEEDYDEWMGKVEREVDQNVNKPAVRWAMICARKPF